MFEDLGVRSIELVEAGREGREVEEAGVILSGRIGLITLQEVIMRIDAMVAAIALRIEHMVARGITVIEAIRRAAIEDRAGATARLIAKQEDAVFLGKKRQEVATREGIAAIEQGEVEVIGLLQILRVKDAIQIGIDFVIGLLGLMGDGIPGHEVGLMAAHRLKKIHDDVRGTAAIHRKIEDHVLDLGVLFGFFAGADEIADGVVRQNALVLFGSEIGFPVIELIVEHVKGIHRRVTRFVIEIEIVKGVRFGIENRRINGGFLGTLIEDLVFGDEINHFLVAVRLLAQNADDIHLGMDANDGMAAIAKELIHQDHAGEIFVCIGGFQKLFDEA